MTDINLKNHHAVHDVMCVSDSGVQGMCTESQASVIWKKQILTIMQLFKELLEEQKMVDNPLFLQEMKDSFQRKINFRTKKFILCQIFSKGARPSGKTEVGTSQTLFMKQSKLNCRGKTDSKFQEVAGFVYSNATMNLIFIVRNFNSVFVLNVRNFLRDGPFNRCAFDNKHLYILNQR